VQLHRGLAGYDGDVQKRTIQLTDRSRPQSCKRRMMPHACASVSPLRRVARSFRTVRAEACELDLLNQLGAKAREFLIGDGS
jgi:hypothetical protein